MAKQKYRIIVVTATVQTPIVPNFLLQEGGGSLPIEAVSDEGLRLIGEAWIEELLAKAARRRKKPKTLQNAPG